METTVKTVFDDDVRKWVVDAKSPSSLLQLASAFCAVYGLDAESSGVLFRYADEENELITVSTQKDFAEALQTAKRADRTLRLIVSTSASRGAKSGVLVPSSAPVVSAAPAPKAGLPACFPEDRESELNRVRASMIQEKVDLTIARELDRSEQKQLNLELAGVADADREINDRAVALALAEDDQQHLAGQQPRMAAVPNMNSRIAQLFAEPSDHVPASFPAPVDAPGNAPSFASIEPIAPAASAPPAPAAAPPAARPSQPSFSGLASGGFEKLMIARNKDESKFFIDANELASEDFSTAPVEVLADAISLCRSIVSLRSDRLSSHVPALNLFRRLARLNTAQRSPTLSQAVRRVIEENLTAPNAWSAACKDAAQAEAWIMLLTENLAAWSEDAACTRLAFGSVLASLALNSSSFSAGCSFFNCVYSTVLVSRRAVEQAAEDSKDPGAGVSSAAAPASSPVPLSPVDQTVLGRFAFEHWFECAAACVKGIKSFPDRSHVLDATLRSLLAISDAVGDEAAFHERMTASSKFPSFVVDTMRNHKARSTTSQIGLELLQSAARHAPTENRAVVAKATVDFLARHLELNVQYPGVVHSVLAVLLALLPQSTKVQDTLAECDALQTQLMAVIRTHLQNASVVEHVIRLLAMTVIQRPYCRLKLSKWTNLLLDMQTVADLDDKVKLHLTRGVALLAG